MVNRKRIDREDTMNKAIELLPPVDEDEEIVARAIALSLQIALRERAPKK